MAKEGIFPIFSMNYVQNIFEDFVTERVNQEIAVLERIGEKFVNDAKTRGQYMDDTGNLRSSIGFIIAWDGKVIKQVFNGKEPDGRDSGFIYAETIMKDYPKGLVLIGVAGMEYAAAVESKGYDVIASSIPSKETLTKAFKEFLGK